MQKKMKLNLDALKVESLEMPAAQGMLRDPSSPKTCEITCHLTHCC